MHENEVARAYKSVNDAYVEPISFIVPRRAEMFQSDIYPPTSGLKPGVSSAEWWQGKEDLPPKIDMESIYNGEAVREAPATIKSQKPTPSPTPTTSAPPPKEAPLSATQVKDILNEAAATTSPILPINRGPPVSIKQASNSMENAAAKFVDKQGSVTSEDEAETSSFEEIAPRKGPPAPLVTSSAPKQETSSTGSPLPLRTPMSAGSQASILSPPADASRLNPRNVAAGGQREVSLQGSLDDIKDLLRKQNETIAAQSAQLDKLTAEMSELRSRSGDQARES